MKNHFVILQVLILFFSVCVAESQDKVYPEQNSTLDSNSVRISLNGECAFALDYANSGDQFEWFSPSINDNAWDRVVLPHNWSYDKRYPFYEGVGWYRKLFSVPDKLKNKHFRLVFEAVYSKSEIWLNGKQINKHNGGYTPFEVDVTEFLNFEKSNLLVVKCDNRLTKIPSLTPQTLRAWMEDGGIIRDMYLEACADIFVFNQKISATPNLQTGSANVSISTWIINNSCNPATINLRWNILKEAEALNIEIPRIFAEIPAKETKKIDIAVVLPPNLVSLWKLDSPTLYSLITTLHGIETLTSVNFGIRKFEVRGTELLFNGSPIRLAGANRIASGENFGFDDPIEFIEKDLRLMKEAGLEFMRMHHVPLSKAVLDWADRNGMLLIEECGNPTDYKSDEALTEDKNKMRVMIERDWNRPSIVAWSIGNEFESDTPDGVKWSKEMKAFVHSIDDTRLICFASNKAAKQNINPDEEASSLMDFVCLNTYGATPDDNATNIDRVHHRWPNKPFIITEYGYLADRVGREQDRELWFSEMIRIIRERPFLSGASIWSFNDYRSRYISTNLNGFRWWGLVDSNRNIRGSYSLIKREFTPIELKEARFSDKSLIIKLAGRIDFPVYPALGYQLNVKFYNARGRLLEVKNINIDSLASGEVLLLNIPARDGVSYFRGEILRGNYSMLIFGPTTWSKK